MSDTTWQNRWKITATLTTKTALHIGGDIPRKRDIYPFADKSKKIENVEVTSVVTDHQGKPYLPGSSIKGNLRSWMKASGYAADIIVALFGSDPQDKDQKGGKVEFYDAFWNETVPSFSDDAQPPWWEPDRQTGISASVAIDRTTGTASDKKLFHLEYVPKGVSFILIITGQDLSEKENGVEKNEVGQLLHALTNGFTDTTHPITLGASTANGWGRFECKDITVEKMEAAKVQAWVKSPQKTGYGYDIPMEKVADWDKLLKAPSVNVTSKLLAIGVELHFDGPFLVNDQSRSKKVRGDDHLADMNPRRGPDGKVILPSASFRGAFRSQAERIIRTMGKTNDACSPRKPCKAIGKKGEESGLCLACRLFGASGWKTLLEVSDFTLKENTGKPFKQEFVAIDRFTGGAKDGAKYKAVSVLNPVFTGSLTIDLSRGEDWMLGLLALTLRDLCEGDITLGYGAAKGYGVCTATITSTAGDEVFSALPASWEKVGEYVTALENQISGGGVTHD